MSSRQLVSFRAPPAKLDAIAKEVVFGHPATANEGLQGVGIASAPPPHGLAADLRKTRPQGDGNATFSQVNKSHFAGAR